MTTFLRPSPDVAPQGLWRAVVALLSFLALVAWTTPAAAADGFLEPEQAFRFDARSAGASEVEVSFQIAPGYYMYRSALKVSAEGATVGELKLPAGKVKFDETFRKEVETYREQLRFTVPLTGVADGAPVTLSVVSQGCADAGLCYPPMTSQAQWRAGQVTLLRAEGADATNASATPAAGGGGLLSRALTNNAGSTTTAASSTGEAALPASSDADAAPLNENQRVEQLLRSGSWWATVGAFWVMGLLLSFTPCVLPMLPILSSILTGGQVVTRGRSFGLAVTYSLGMAMVYTALGVAAGLAGEGLAAALQKPAVLAAFGTLLVLFSLSMFDVYELRLPSALADRLDGASRRLPGGQLFGVFLMGGLSALIVSPCVTAPLAGALLFLSQTRDVVLAGSALFALAVGMSVPLLLLGASAGAWLPRSGAWMNVVKRFFGLLLLAVALWIVQPVMPGPVVLALWGALLLMVSFMLRPFDASPHPAAPRTWLQRSAGMAALAWALMLLVGAASGGRDPLQPLSHLNRPAASAEVAVTNDALRFQMVRSVEELDAVLAQAKRPVMLDFYADWCVSCKEMERFTFSDPQIRTRLEQAVLLKADVTANSDADRALLKRFKLFGPPGTIFFDAAGQERVGQRVVGFQDAKNFGKSLTNVGL